MSDDLNIKLEVGIETDLLQITDIYNWYVKNTAITFDLEQQSLESRQKWFGQFSPNSRHQLWVARQGNEVLGYAASLPFRAKAAYKPSVENSIYLHPDAKGKGIGKTLLRHLLQELSHQDVHRVLACITLPNDTSIALHQNMGFKHIGVFSEVGRKFDRYHDVSWLEYIN